MRIENFRFEFAEYLSVVTHRDFGGHGAILRRSYACCHCVNEGARRSRDGSNVQGSSDNQ
jgi:hypothetical protein